VRVGGLQFTTEKGFVTLANEEKAVERPEEGAKEVARVH